MVMLWYIYYTPYVVYVCAHIHPSQKRYMCCVYGIEGTTYLFENCSVFSSRFIFIFYLLFFSFVRSFALSLSLSLSLSSDLALSLAVCSMCVVAFYFVYYSLIRFIEIFTESLSLAVRPFTRYSCCAVCVVGGVPM